MRRIFTAVLVGLLCLSASAAFAIQPLPYEDSFRVGVLVEHKQLDVKVDDKNARLRGTGYGALISYADKSIDFAAHLGLSDHDLKTKGNDDDKHSFFHDDDRVSGGSSLGSLEVSKGLFNFGDGLRLGVTGRVERFFGKFRKDDDRDDDSGKGSGKSGSGSDDRDEDFIRDLTIWEVCLPLQKDWKQAHFYIGPMLRFVNGEVARDDSSGSGDDDDRRRERLKERSPLGGFVGITADLTDRVSIGASATFNRELSAKALLNVKLF